MFLCRCVLGLLAKSARKPRSPFEPHAIGSAAFNADPYPFYTHWRAKTAVHRVDRFLGQPAWLILRYDEAAAVLKDERFVKAAANAMSREQLAQQPWFRKVRLFKSLQHNM